MSRYVDSVGDVAQIRYGQRHWNVGFRGFGTVTTSFISVCITISGVIATALLVSPTHSVFGTSMLVRTVISLSALAAIGVTFSLSSDKKLEKARTLFHHLAIAELANVTPEEASIAQCSWTINDIYPTFGGGRSAVNYWRDRCCIRMSFKMPEAEVERIKSCENQAGGFAYWPDGQPNLRATAQACELLAAIGSIPNRFTHADWILKTYWNGESFCQAPNQSAALEDTFLGVEVLAYCNSLHKIDRAVCCRAVCDMWRYGKRDLESTFFAARAVAALDGLRSELGAELGQALELLSRGFGQLRVAQNVTEAYYVLATAKIVEEYLGERGRSTIDNFRATAAREIVAQLKILKT
jgi:hypothetical protein